MTTTRRQVSNTGYESRLSARATRKAPSLSPSTNSPPPPHRIRPKWKEKKVRRDGDISLHIITVFAIIIIIINGPPRAPPSIRNNYYP